MRLHRRGRVHGQNDFGGGDLIFDAAEHKAAPGSVMQAQPLPHAVHAQLVEPGVLSGVQNIPLIGVETLSVVDDADVQQVLLDVAGDADAWFTFKTLTFPMLKPFMYIALLFRLMAALQEFGIIYALSKGGPGNTLMNLSLTSYITGFTYQKLAAALPYLLVLWYIINKAAEFLVKRQRFLAKQALGQ